MTIVTFSAISLAAAVVVVTVWARSAKRPDIHYPYICKDCGAVFDVSELRADTANWRVPAGAPNDSVVVCLRCNKGWAYPVRTCDVCGTKYVMYLTKDPRCPKCFPEAADAARQAGVDVLYKGPGPITSRPAAETQPSASRPAVERDATSKPS